MTQAWVYAETRAQRLPHVRLGRYVRYRREAIDAWLERSERGLPGGRERSTVMRQAPIRSDRRAKNQSRWRSAPTAPGSLYEKHGAYYGRWRTPDGRLLNRRIGRDPQRGRAATA